MKRGYTSAVDRFEGWGHRLEKDRDGVMMKSGKRNEGKDKF